jgi:large subunit ribosomal protein L29
MVKAVELNQLDEDELDSRLAEAKQELFNLRFQLATGQLDNVARISQVRRDVARMKTILREREIAAAEAIAAEEAAAAGEDTR